MYRLYASSLGNDNILPHKIAKEGKLIQFIDTWVHFCVSLEKGSVF